MRAKELFNKLTLGKKLLVVGMALGLSSTAHSVELANSYTDLQFEAQRCDSSTSNWRTSQREFSLACADAGLGSVSSCESKLEKCESSNNKYSYCIGSATTRDDHQEALREKRDQERELQERKNTMLADYQDKQTEIQRAKETQDQIQKSLQETLTGYDDLKVQTQLDLENKLDEIADGSAATRDQIDIEQLNLRKSVVDQDTACREKAIAEKNEYIAATRGRKLTVNQIFGRTGLSVNQAGSIRYEKVMSNCLALFTDTGKITNFGKKYRLQRKNIEIQKNILKRQIASYERQKQRVIKNTKNALAMMDQKKQAAYISATNANLRAQQNVQLLETQRNDLMAQINQLDGKMMILGKEVSKEQVGMVVGLTEKLTGVKSTPQSVEKVAKEEKIKAFNKALGLKDSMGFAEDDRKDVCESQKVAAEVAAGLDTYEISGSADLTSATATEITTTDRTPATAGQTL